MNYPITRERLQDIATEFDETIESRLVDVLVTYLRTMIVLKATVDSPHFDVSNNFIFENILPTEFLVDCPPKKLNIKLPLALNNIQMGNLAFEERMYFLSYMPLNTNRLMPTIIQKLQDLFTGVSFTIDLTDGLLRIDWS